MKFLFSKKKIFLRKLRGELKPILPVVKEKLKPVKESKEKEMDAT